MIERFQNRLPFSRWHPQVLRDYCEFGILPRGGEFALACPPDIEASIYHESKVPESDIYPEIRARSAAGHGDSRGQDARAGRVRSQHIAHGTGPGGALSAGRDMVFEDCTHYIPMEAPERVVEQIRRQTDREASGSRD
jgi:hypothetical protein